MIRKEEVLVREKYLKKIRPFYSSDLVKVITGIRRCGKSTILKTIIKELREGGVNEEKIIYLPLDNKGYKSIKTPEELEAKIEEKITSDGLYYILIDEVQNVKGFESVVLSYVEEKYSVFLTGSNSYLLSDEISTKLTGRYLLFEIFTLDFKEYIEMKKIHSIHISPDLYEEFSEYLLNGGFPKSLEFETRETREFYTASIIEEIFNKDVRTRNKITNKNVFERVQSYLINNYSSPFSITNLVDELQKEGFKTKLNTVKAYIEDLKKAKIVYECNRFDLKSKKSLKREQKYYLADLAIYYAMNTNSSFSLGPSLENIVYTYLRSNDYLVSVGRIGKFECDFIIRNRKHEFAYIQVAYTLQGESKEATERIKEREYRPFRSIKDGWPRYIISLDRIRDKQEGIYHINVLDLFLGKEKLII